MNINYDLPGENVTGFFNHSQFNAGEHRAWVKELEVDVIPTQDVYFVDNGLDLMRIGMMVDILRRRGCEKVSLVLPYLPYSRQDRYTVNGESFSLKVLAQFINSLRLYRVYTVDAHSDVCGVIDNLIDLPITHCIDQILCAMDFLPIILSPDAGASKKIHNIMKTSAYVDDLKFLIAGKSRNVATGEITGTYVPAIPEGEHVLIIDDISDGGRTFIEIAKKLDHSISKYIFITHGIFSKPDLFPHFIKVFTTDSMYHMNKANNVVEIKLNYHKGQKR